MIWGGLEIIVSRLVIDSITVLGLSYSLLTNPNTFLNTIILLSTCAVTIYTLSTCAGGAAVTAADADDSSLSLLLTLRWTITFPMIPIVVLQFIRRVLHYYYSDDNENNNNNNKNNRRLFLLSWLLKAIFVLSLFFTIISAVLSVWLFPPLKLPATKGQYNVGVVDFFIPRYNNNNNGYCYNNRNNINLNNDNSIHNNSTDDPEIMDASSTDGNNIYCSASKKQQQQKYISARLLYPTTATTTISAAAGLGGKKHPYLKPNIALEFCKQSMKAGGPPFIKNFHWLLHHWILSHTDAIRNAPLLEDGNKKSKLPLVVFSHGLLGNADVYSYQTMALASKGLIVLIIEHTDGSSPAVKNKDGTLHTYDFSVNEVESHEERTFIRRAGTDLRVNEMIKATEVFLSLNDDGGGGGDEKEEEEALGTKITIPEFDNIGFSIKNRINKEQVFFMGHSYGGATALTAGKRRPDLINGIIALEPAVDWIPNDTRRSLFADDKLQGISHNYTGGTGGYSSSIYENEENIIEMGTSVHDINLITLFSQQWKDAGWGMNHLLHDMYQMGKFGPASMNGVSDFGYISGAVHNEFSDLSMITPLWLARGIGFTGERNPLDTARDIEDRTWSFVQSVLNKQANENTSQNDN